MVLIIIGAVLIIGALILRKFLNILKKTIV